MPQNQDGYVWTHHLPPLWFLRMAPLSNKLCKSDYLCYYWLHPLWCSPVPLHLKSSKFHLLNSHHHLSKLPHLTTVISQLVSWHLWFSFICFKTTWLTICFKIMGMTVTAQSTPSNIAYKIFYGASPACLSRLMSYSNSPSPIHHPFGSSLHS